MFNDLTFRNKLAVLMLPPVVALAILLGAVVVPRLSTANEANRSKNDAQLALKGTRLQTQFGLERGLASRLLATSGKNGRNELDAQRKATDEARVAFLDAAKDHSLPVVQQAVESVNRLDALRSSVDTFEIDSNIAFDGYTGMTSNLIALQAAIATSTKTPELLPHVQSVNNVVNAQEAISKQQGALTARLATDEFTTPDFVEFANLNNLENDAYSRIEAVASNSDRVKAVTQGPEFRQAQELIDEVLAAGQAGKTPTFTADEWWQTMSEKLDVANKLTQQELDEFVSVAERTTSSARTSAALWSLIGLIAVAFAIATAALVARTIVKRLRRLTDHAHEIANDRLPEVLETLRNPTPDALANALPQVKADARDEIGDVADSFNTVLRTAVDNAIEHTDRRSRIMTTLLVNLGRRNQTLIDEQLDIIDELEGQEQNPETLERLFKLDHTATRLRRNAENLLVLGADAPARSWTAAVPIEDVMRGAVAEVSAIERVKVESKPGDRSAVMGRFAVDLSHLVAELIENAVSFSPPRSTVVVRAERAANLYRVWVVDEGVGIAESEMADHNQRLLSPSEIDAVTADRVGFQVVARLASRLGVKVSLHPNPSGGVAAKVEMPMDLFDSGQSADGQAGGESKRDRAPAAAQKSASASNGQAAGPRLGSPGRKNRDNGGRQGGNNLPVRTPQPAAPAADAAAAAAPAAAAPAAVASSVSTPPATRVAAEPVARRSRDHKISDAQRPAQAPAPVADTPAPAVPAAPAPAPVAPQAAAAEAPAPAPAAPASSSPTLARRIPGRNMNSNLGPDAVTPADTGTYRRIPTPEEHDPLDARRFEMLSGLRDGVDAGRAAELPDEAELADIIKEQ